MKQKLGILLGIIIGIIISSFGALFTFYLKDNLGIKLPAEANWILVAMLFIGIGGAITVLLNRNYIAVENIPFNSIPVCIFGSFVFAAILMTFDIFGILFIGGIIAIGSNIVGIILGSGLYMLSKPKGVKSEIEENRSKRIIIPEGEKIIGAIYDVVGRPNPWSTNIGNLFVPPKGKWPYWASGSQPMPSNALFFTEKRIIAMFIGMPQKDISKVIPFGVNKVYFNLEEVKKEGKELIETKTPTDMINSNNNNLEMPFEEIVETSLKKMRKKGSIGDTFTIKTTDKKKIRYVFLKKEYVSELEEILSKVLPSKSKTESGKFFR